MPAMHLPFHMLDAFVVHEVPFTRVAEQPLAEPRVIAHVVREALPHDQADQRLVAIGDQLVRDAVRRTADEIAGPDRLTVRPRESPARRR